MTRPNNSQTPSRSHVSPGSPSMSSTADSAPAGATEIDRRRPEGTLDVWLRDAQRKHAETDNGEGKQRADAHQLTDKPDRQQPRQNRDDDADGNGADVRRAEARMNFGAEWRQQPVARHGIEDARLAD